ncbi:acetyl-CoA synthetase-like protein [Lentithecium fluviatile CBS 122367]|uniref:Acetyl-CoA synthetase-like protein n=1 Tax=Lentithecium fluviatile CBS 122367 TaxID=1168545 RepID=A0A6G1JDG4_9PLEO|nr:acetyl-CoA synthetase-like protein [Lentithecium fluviatile CBS 122367]
MAQREGISGRESQLSIITGPKTPELVDLTFNHVLHNACLNHPNRLAPAGGLHSLGVGKGDRVGVLLGNRSEYVEIMFACFKLGAYFTLFNYAYSSSELINALNVTAPKVPFTALTISRYDYTAVLGKLQGAAYLKDIIILDDASNPSASEAGLYPFLAYHDVQ